MRSSSVCQLQVWWNLIIWRRVLINLLMCIRHVGRCDWIFRSVTSSFSFTLIHSHTRERGRRQHSVFLFIRCHFPFFYVFDLWWLMVAFIRRTCPASECFLSKEILPLDCIFLYLDDIPRKSFNLHYTLLRMLSIFIFYVQSISEVTIYFHANANIFSFQ